MGYLTAFGIAEADIPLEQQVAWHFSSNCYPPVPQYMVPVAIEAIEAILDDDYDREIDLPEGVTFRGCTKVSPADAVETLFLFAFVDALLAQEEE